MTGRKRSMRGRRSNWYWWVVVATILLLGVLRLTADSWSTTIVSRVDDPKPADAIVVLGGLVSPRSETAAGLYQQGMAPQIFVSGRGDAQTVRSRLLALGVPQAVKTVEDLSANTYENAERIAPLLRDADVRSALIVTSWFHSRRAYNCFWHAAPAVEFRVIAPGREVGKERYENACARQEVMKVLFYILRYGIMP